MGLFFVILIGIILITVIYLTIGTSSSSSPIDRISGSGSCAQDIIASCSDQAKGIARLTCLAKASNENPDCVADPRNKSQLQNFVNGY